MREGRHQRAHRGGQRCPLGPQPRTQSPGCSVSPESSPGWGMGLSARCAGLQHPNPGAPLTRVSLRGGPGGGLGKTRKGQGQHRGVVQKPQAETKVLSALPLETEGFQPRALCPWSSSPAVQKGVVSLRPRSCKPESRRALKAASPLLHSQDDSPRGPEQLGRPPRAGWALTTPGYPPGAGRAGQRPGSGRGSRWTRP